MNTKKFTSLLTLVVLAGAPIYAAGTARPMRAAGKRALSVVAVITRPQPLVRTPSGTISPKGEQRPSSSSPKAELPPIIQYEVQTQATPLAPTSAPSTTALTLSEPPTTQRGATTVSAPAESPVATPRASSSTASSSSTTTPVDEHQSPAPTPTPAAPVLVPTATTSAATVSSTVGSTSTAPTTASVPQPQESKEGKTEQKERPLLNRSFSKLLAIARGTDKTPEEALTAATHAIHPVTLVVKPTKEHSRCVTLGGTEGCGAIYSGVKSTCDHCNRPLTFFHEAPNQSCLFLTPGAAQEHQAKVLRVKQAKLKKRLIHFKKAVDRNMKQQANITKRRKQGEASLTANITKLVSLGDSIKEELRVVNAQLAALPKPTVERKVRTGVATPTVLQPSTTPTITPDLVAQYNELCARLNLPLRTAKQIALMQIPGSTMMRVEEGTAAAARSSSSSSGAHSRGAAATPASHASSSSSSSSGSSSSSSSKSWVSFF